METPLPQVEESTPPGDQNPPSNKDVEMQDDTLQIAVGGEGAVGGNASPINKEEDEMLDEPQMPHTQVISEMQNLSVGSPANLTQSQTETQL